MQASNTAPRFCPKCGTQAVSDAAFCAKCGTLLDTPAPVPPPPITLQAPPPFPANLSQTPTPAPTKKRPRWQIFLAGGLVLCLALACMSSLLNRNNGGGNSTPTVAANATMGGTAVAAVSQPTPTVATPAPPTATAAEKPIPTPVPTKPPPTAAPTQTPIPPTPVPAPIPVIDPSGRLTTTSVVGGDVTFTLTIRNAGPGEIGALTVNISQSYMKHFILIRTDPVMENDDSWGSRIFHLGSIPEGVTYTYTIVMSPKEAGEFSGPVQFFDRSRPGAIGTQLKFPNGNQELGARTTVRAR